MSGRVIDLADPARAGTDIAAYAEARLRDQLPSDERREVVAHVTRAAEGNFLYAKLALDGLLAGAPTPAQILANIDRVIDPERPSEPLRDAFVGMAQRIVGFDAERWAQQFRPFLGPLAVARNGLTLSQLVGITQRTQSEVGDSLRLLGSFLVGPKPNGPYRIFHTGFARFTLTEPEYGVSAAEAHEGIATFLLAEYQNDWTRCTDAEALRDAPYHLLAAVRGAPDQRKRRQLIDQLVALLLEPAYLQARLAAASP